MDEEQVNASLPLIVLAPGAYANGRVSTSLATAASSPIELRKQANRATATVETRGERISLASLQNYKSEASAARNGAGKPRE